MSKKKLILLILLGLLALGGGVLFLRKSYIKKPSYISIIGPVHMTDGIGKQTAELADLLSQEFSVDIISDNVNLVGVPSRILKLLTHKNKRLGTVVIYEDCVWKEENNASMYLKTVANSTQIRIAYSMLEFTRIPQEWVMQLNLYFDAVAVPDPFLIEVYQRSGVKIPIFVVPLGVDLQDFLKIPIKEKKNPVFLFGNLGTVIDRKNQIVLVKAFAKAFGNVEGVALHINARGGGENVRKELLEEIRKQDCSNIFFTELRLKRDAYIKFFQTLDCYVSLSKGEGFSIQPREAMALRIPVVASNNTGQKTLCDSSLVTAVRSEILERGIFFGRPLLFGQQFNCEEEDVVKGLVEVYQNYEQHLQKAKKARDWVSFYDYRNSHLQNLYKSLVSPKRIVLGPRNEVHEEYLMTTSRELYDKYYRLAKIRSDVPLDTCKTPVLDALKPIELSSSSSGLQGIDCIYVINLDERPTRWEHAKRCFQQEGLCPNRVSAINGWKIPIEKQMALIDPRAPLLSG